MATSDYTVNRSNAFRGSLPDLNLAISSSPVHSNHSQADDQIEEAIHNVSIELLNLMDSSQPAPQNPTVQDDDPAVISCTDAVQSPLLGANAPVIVLDSEGLPVQLPRLRRNVRRPENYKTFHSIGRF